MEDRPICMLGGSFYFWRLSIFEESISDGLSKKILLLEDTFEKRFFQISHGNTDSLKLEFNLVISSLEKIIPNIKLDILALHNGIETLFNNFHYEVQEFKSQKAREICSIIKQNYAFNDVQKRFLRKELLLNEEEEKFLMEIFDLEVFRAEVISKKFISRFEGFIDEYNNKIENDIKEVCMRSEEEFMHTVGLMTSFTKRKIQEFFNNIIASLRLQRVIISNFQINSEAEEQKNQWVTVFEDFYCKEEMRLKQVIQTSEDSVFILISFEDSNRVAIITFSGLESKVISPLISDKETIIASGSNSDSLVLFKNTDEKAVLGSIFDGSTFEESKEKIPIYNYVVARIVSGCYLRKHKEILFINFEGKLFYYCLGKNPREISQLQDKIYHSISVSLSEDFILLSLPNDFFLVSSNLTIVYIEGNRPHYPAIHEPHLKMLKISEQNEITIKPVMLYAGYFTERSRGELIIGRVGSGVGGAISLGFNLVSNLFRSNNYEISKPEVVTSNLGTMPDFPIKKILLIQRMWRRRKARISNEGL